MGLALALVRARAAGMFATVDRWIASRDAGMTRALTIAGTRWW